MYAEFNGDVHFFFFLPKIFFLYKFGPKNQNFPFKLKLGSKTNSYMENSMVRFIFFVFDWKHLFWVHLFPNIKTVSLKIENWYHYYFVHAEFRGDVHFFCFRPETFFCANLVQKIKIVRLNWVLARRLIRIWRTQWWCSLFPFSPGITFFGQIYPKNKNCLSKVKFGN